MALISIAPTTEHRCDCGLPLRTPYEQRNQQCFDCEDNDARMFCTVCGEHVGWAYTDGRPTICSEDCEERYYDSAIS